MQSEAIVFTHPCKAALRPIDVPQPAGDELLVEIHYSCLSPGTESRVLSGQQSGAPVYPFIPGYSAAGRVIQAGPQASLKPGSRVFVGGGTRASLATCWGAHAGHVVVSESSVCPVPDNVSLKQASAAKLAAIALHGVRLSKPLAGECVAILGLGPIGFFSALLHQTQGLEVAVSDTQAARCELARKLGLRVFKAGEGAFPRGADIVVDATGFPPALQKAASLLRDLPWDNTNHPPTRFVIQGSYAIPPPLPYETLFLKESRVLIPRDNQRQDVEAVLSLMEKPGLPLDTLLADLGPPSNATLVYADMKSALGEALTGFFTWRKAG